MNEIIVPAITLYQPWATWVVLGLKTIETRTHSRFKTLLHRSILIHAGQNLDNTATPNPYLTNDRIVQTVADLKYGHIVGSAYVSRFGVCDPTDSGEALIDCKSTTRYGLWLTDIRRWDEPVPCAGDRGIWYFDLEKKKKVRKPKLNFQNQN